MGHSFFNRAPVSLMVQKGRLIRLYGDLIEKCNISKNELSCIMLLRPTVESDAYRIKIGYKMSERCPKAWILSPPIKKVDGRYPHHIYGWNNGYPQLCVYYPGFSEWTQQMDIATSFVPWILTWLCTYEFWVITGEWHYDEAPHRAKDRQAIRDIENGDIQPPNFEIADFTIEASLQDDVVKNKK